ncbi:MAG: PAS domain S-box protein [SAR324 cluster bacterium]|nr:PAS domain S-box protein [SAR324 cluster bacterium]
MAKTILIIDDEEQVCILLSQFLKRKGYEVYTATNGYEGIKQFREHPTDLVITDIIMPRKNGVEVIMELRRAFADVDIIAISGGGKVGELDYLAEARFLGASHTFEKPVPLKKLGSVIEAIFQEQEKQLKSGKIRTADIHAVLIAPQKSAFVETILKNLDQLKHILSHSFLIFARNQMVQSQVDDKVDILLLVSDGSLASIQLQVQFFHETLPNLPIIVLQEEMESIDSIKILQLGAQDLLFGNDLNASSLERTIRYAIERFQMLIELKHYTQGLLNSENRFKSIIRHIVDGILIIDPDKKIRFANPVAEKLLNRSEKDMEGQDFRYPVSSGEFLEVEIQNEKQVRTVEIRGVEIDWNGVPCTLASLRDISQRKRAENEWIKLSLAVEQSPAMVFITNPDGIIEYVNPRFTHITGFASAELVGQPLQKIFPEPVISNIFLTVQQGQLWQGEWSIHDEKGTDVWISGSMSSIRDAKQKIRYLVGVGEDITTRKRVEEELIVANQQLLFSFEELERINQIFQLFVPKAFLNRIELFTDLQGGQFEEENLTILFADIRSYTHYAERMTPQQNFDFLNTFFRLTEPVISKNQGFVDKFIGDAVMALFDGENSANHALNAAIEMQETVAQYNQEHQGEYLQEIKFGIGINTGPVMVGAMGSATRINSTVIGDNVNLSARLETLTKKYHSNILISFRTYDALLDKENYNIREIDTVQVRGKSEPTIIYDVFDADPPSLKMKKIETQLLLFQGIVLYKAQSFAEAIDCFEESLGIFPEDVICINYLKRCRYFQKYPPGEIIWDGVVKDTDNLVDHNIRRRTDRFHLNVPINLFVPENDIQLAGTTLDISMGGLKIQTHHLFEKGQILKVELFFKESNLEQYLAQIPFQFICQVIWSFSGSIFNQQQTWEHGLEFIVVTKSQDESLTLLFNKLKETL